MVISYTVWKPWLHIVYNNRTNNCAHPIREGKETMYGYTGKILHVDLTNHKLSIEESPESF